MPLLSTTIGFLEPIAIALVNGICHMYRSGVNVDVQACERGLVRRPHVGQLVRPEPHRARQQLLADRPSPELDQLAHDRSQSSGSSCSAAVAARSAGCSYAFGEIWIEALIFRELGHGLKVAGL